MSSSEADSSADVGSSADSPKSVQDLDRIAIRFAGDSGDGMQLTGMKFTDETALAGNDLSTFPDFPAEIRAPAGTMAGVSGFQIHFSSDEIHTPADKPDLLVAFNPAALRANVEDVRSSGMVIVNSDAFTAKSIARAGYTEEDPLAALRDRFRVIEVPFTTLNRAASSGLDLGQRDIDRCKNFFALGLMCWLYGRSMEATERFLSSKFKGAVLEANLRALRAGRDFGEHTELFPVSFNVGPAKIEPGTYRNITGNTALAWGIVAASVQMNRPLLLGAYPITPASDVLHEVARHRNFGVKTFQAEDEMAAVSSAIGAAFAGHLGVTVSSGPGFILKQEALALAVMTELPVVVVDVQRSGPSTGMPTKTEQGDLLLALYGRNSSSPMPVLAPATPGDCFHTMIEAFALAVRFMTPVVVLSDGYLANSSEPWKIPAVETLPRSEVRYRTEPEGFLPYERDPDTLARPWAVPGTPGLAHRIGGLERAEDSGEVSYDAANHQRMTDLRAAKIAGIAKDIPEQDVELGEPSGPFAVVGWGSTYGPINRAVSNLRARGLEVSHVHLRHLSPLPRNLGELLGGFDRVLVPEMNKGQLLTLLRSVYLLPAEGLHKVTGKPFKIAEIEQAILRLLETKR